MAKVQDAVSMSIVHAHSWRRAYKGLLPDDYLNELEDTRWVDMFSNGLKDGSLKGWVATVEDKIVGCACVGDSRYQGYEGQFFPV